MTSIKNILLIATALFIPFSSVSDEYHGTLGNINISMSFTATDEPAVYMYDKHRTPISLYFVSKDDNNTIKYIEENNGISVAELYLIQKNGAIDGYWKNIKTGRHHPISLIFIDDPRGNIQSTSFDDTYVRIRCDDTGKKTHIINKKTDKTEFILTSDGICNDDELEIDDYNFDGYPDFSVFESYYAGPNTSRTYYLYDPKTKHYAETDQLSLTSLDFDIKTKTVTSTNQCCAGAQILIDKYKWVGNKLKLVDGVCLVRDDRGEQIEKTRESCN